VVDFHYDAVNPDELTLQVGQKVRVDEVIDEGWWAGQELSTGRRGLFPSNFVRRINGTFAAGAQRAFPKHFGLTLRSPPVRPVVVRI